MTKFKKCDFCKNPDKNLRKMKTQTELFKPDNHYSSDGEGGDVSWRLRPVIIFLCSVCYDYFFPNQDTKLITVETLTKEPELYKVMMNKGNWVS